METCSLTPGAGLRLSWDTDHLSSPPSQQSYESRTDRCATFPDPASRSLVKGKPRTKWWLSRSDPRKNEDFFLSVMTTFFVIVLFWIITDVDPFSSYFPLWVDLVYFLFTTDRYHLPFEAICMDRTRDTDHSGRVEENLSELDYFPQN